MLEIRAIYLGDDERYSLIVRAFEEQESQGNVKLKTKLKYIQQRTYVDVQDSLVQYYYGIDGSGEMGKDQDYDLIIYDMAYKGFPDGGLTLWEQLGDEIKLWLESAYFAVLSRYDMMSDDKPAVAIRKMFSLLKSERPAGNYGYYLFNNYSDILSMLDTIYP